MGPLAHSRSEWPSHQGADLAVERKPAACNKPQTWGTYRHACYALHRFRCDGIGFVFTHDDPFCGIDIDHCRSADGTIAPEAQAVIERIGSYTELSPSRTGVHILLQGALA